MARKPNAYPLPANYEVERRLTCVKIPVYDDFEWYSILWGHLWELSKWYNFQHDDNGSGKFVADKFRDWLTAAREEFENDNACAVLEADIDFRIGDGGVTYSDYLDIGCGSQQTPYDDSGGGPFGCGTGWGHVQCDLGNNVHQSGAGITDWFSYRTISQVTFRFSVRTGNLNYPLNWRLGIQYEGGVDWVVNGSDTVTGDETRNVTLSGYFPHVQGFTFEVWTNTDDLEFFYPCVRIIGENYLYDLE